MDNPLSAENDIKLPELPAWSSEHVPDEGYGRALKVSFGLHVIFIALILFKNLVFPGIAKPYVPTLRVDMVDLPDVLKKDIQNTPVTPSAKEIASALKNAENDAKKIQPVEHTDPDEMVLKPKKVAITPPEKPVKREKNLRSALDRIKALSRIEAESKSDNAAPSVIVKGNKLSKGTSTSGDAKESDQTNYYDSLRAKLQENWALPVWLARQNLDAQVRIYVDANGRVRSFRFMKLSGNPQFDAAIKKTLDDSQPFPRPPDEVASSLLVDGVLIGFPL